MDCIATIKFDGRTYEISLQGSELKARYAYPNSNTILSCTVKLLGQNKILVNGAGVNTRLTLKEEKYNLLQQALNTDNPIKEDVEFNHHHDLETGLTYYTLRNRISRQAWLRVAHLFEQDVTLDCPEGREWNDHITLKWATTKPEQVKQLLS